MHVDQSLIRPAAISVHSLGPKRTLEPVITSFRPYSNRDLEPRPTAHGVRDAIFHFCACVAAVVDTGCRLNLNSLSFLRTVHTHKHTTSRSLDIP